MKWIFFLLIIVAFLYAAFSPQSPFYTRFHPISSETIGEPASSDTTENDSSQTSLESNILDTLENIKK